MCVESVSELSFDELPEPEEDFIVALVDGGCSFNPDIFEKYHNPVESNCQTHWKSSCVGVVSTNYTR